MEDKKKVSIQWLAENMDVGWRVNALLTNLPRAFINVATFGEAAYKVSSVLSPLPDWTVESDGLYTVFLDEENQLPLSLEGDYEAWLDYSDVRPISVGLAEIQEDVFEQITALLVDEPVAAVGLVDGTRVKLSQRVNIIKYWDDQYAPSAGDEGTLTLLGTIEDQECWAVVFDLDPDKQNFLAGQLDSGEIVQMVDVCEVIPPTHPIVPFDPSVVGPEIPDLIPSDDEEFEDESDWDELLAPDETPEDDARLYFEDDEDEDNYAPTDDINPPGYELYQEWQECKMELDRLLLECDSIEAPDSAYNYPRLLYDIECAKKFVKEAEEEYKAFEKSRAQ